MFVIVIIICTYRMKYDTITSDSIQRPTELLTEFLTFS